MFKQRKLAVIQRHHNQNGIKFAIKPAANNIYKAPYYIRILKKLRHCISQCFPRDLVHILMTVYGFTLGAFMHMPEHRAYPGRLIRTEEEQSLNPAAKSCICLK